MCLTIALLLVICVLYYDVKMRSSRLYKSIVQYPACCVELPVIGCLYRLIGSSEASGRVIPTGAGTCLPILSIHRNPKYWGADAEHFDPERFLPERLASVPKNAYMPFSYGPRGCPGHKFANNITKICLCAILRKYKLIGEPAATPGPNIQTKFEIAMKAVNNYQIQLVHRV